MHKKNRATAARWFHILCLGFAGACAIRYAAPFVWEVIEKCLQVLVGEASIVGLLVLGLVGVAGVWNCHRIARIELRHGRHVFRYPPLPVSILLAAAAAPMLPAFSGGLLGKAPPFSWGNAGLLASIYAFLWLIQALARNPRTRPKGVTYSARRRTAERRVQLSDDELEEWLKREEPVFNPHFDLFGHSVIADGLIERLQREESTIALQGPLGSGKSTVCHIARSEAKSRNLDLIFVFASCWGFGDAAQAQKDVLNSILHEVGKEVDCLSIRELPDAYIDAVAGHSAWIKTVLKLSGPKLAPLEQLRRLSPILSAIGKKVVLVVEDVDRTGERFDVAQIQALLMQFRRVERVSFVLAMSPLQAVDFAKICDYLEIIPPMQRGEILRLVHQTRELLLRRNPPGIILNKLDALVAEDDDYTIFDRSLRHWWPWQIGLCDLLNRPRLLKHALRRIWEAWPRLSGEVHCDHMIAVAALRAGAPKAFSFLSERFPLFRPAMAKDDPQLRENARIRFKEDLVAEWNAISDDKRFDPRAAAVLLAHVYPMTAAATGSSHAHSVIAQSMQSERRGEVYARRLLTEHLDPSEVRDQRILSLMDRSASDPTALAELAEEITDSPYASSAFEDFSGVGKFNQELPLLSEVYAVIRRRHGPRADRDECPGFFAPWRRINNNRTGGFEDWLVTEIRKCIPGHLGLLTKIYYYWLGTEAHSREERVRARQAIVDGLRETWASIPPESVANGFDPVFPYVLFHLVFTSDYQMPDTVPLGTIDDWAWSGSLLLKASEANPQAVLPQILIALNSDDERGGPVPRYSIDLKRLEKWFGTEAKTLLALATRGFTIHPEVPEQTKYLLLRAIEKVKAASAS
jgi:hypothetical protein